MFYTHAMPIWVCPRCNVSFEVPLWTVPISLPRPTSEPNWMQLCADCFRAVLGVEPPVQRHRELLMQPRPPKSRRRSR